MDNIENSVDLERTMQIIIQAGDARKIVIQALDLIGDAKYDEARLVLNTAHQKLLVAHGLQTEKIQQEAQGQKLSYPVLFTHAQDTMMSVDTEFNLVKHLIDIFQKRIN